MKEEKVNKTPNVFGGFEALSKSLLGSGGPISNADDEIPYKDPEDIDDDVDDEVKDEEDEPVKPVKKTVPEKEPVEDEDEELSEDTDEEDEETDDKTKTSGEDDTEDIETEVTGFLKNRLSEELGWEIDDETKLESIKDIIGYMGKLVDENSKPRYHSKEVQELDEYVKNGGSIDKYFKEVYGASTNVDYDNIDLSRESNQRLVVKELLKSQGLSSERIQKRLDRYEKEEMLQEEAEDAVELLKEYKSKNEKKLLDDQRKQADDQVKQQQNFLQNVQTSVKNLDNIRGIKISSKDKQELLEYIFKPDSEGLTAYQKDYMSDIKNLIESAYFTKMGDVLIDEAKKKGSSDAYKEFHQKLKANKGRRSKNSGSLESGSDSDFVLSSLSKNLLNKV